jgi:hypothetical protein
MTTPFNELPIGALFQVPNVPEIIHNRGDQSPESTRRLYENNLGTTKLVLRKRDEFGAHFVRVNLYGDDSIYYRIELDNVVETV